MVLIREQGRRFNNSISAVEFLSTTVAIKDENEGGRRGDVAIKNDNMKMWINGY